MDLVVGLRAPPVANPGGYLIGGNQCCIAIAVLGAQFSPSWVFRCFPLLWLRAGRAANTPRRPSDRLASPPLRQRYRRPEHRSRSVSSVLLAAQARPPSRRQ